MDRITQDSPNRRDRAILTLDLPCCERIQCIMNSSAEFINRSQRVNASHARESIYVTKESTIIRKFVTISGHVDLLVRTKNIQARLDLILGKAGSKAKDVYDSKQSLASRIVKVERSVEDIESKLDQLLEMYMEDRRGPVQPVPPRMSRLLHGGPPPPPPPSIAPSIAPSQRSVTPPPMATSSPPPPPAAGGAEGTSSGGGSDGGGGGGPPSMAFDSSSSNPLSSPPAPPPSSHSTPAPIPHPSSSTFSSYHHLQQHQSSETLSFDMSCSSFDQCNR